MTPEEQGEGDATPLALATCRRVENRIPIYDDRQFFLYYIGTQIIKRAFSVFYCCIKSIGTERTSHAFVGGASNAGGAGNFAEFFLGFAYTKIFQNHLEASRSAIGVLMGNRA